MRHNLHMKTIQAGYFAEYFAIRQSHPDITGKDAWILTEMRYDYDMYISYASFRVALCKHIRIERSQNKKFKP